MKILTKYGDATIEELEGDKWGEPGSPAPVVNECYRLRHLQLRRLTVENIRMLLGQNIGLYYLVPLAIEHLSEDPLLQAAFYPGDLLCTVLRVNGSFWISEPTARAEIEAIVERGRALAATKDTNVMRWLDESIATFSSGASAKSANVYGGKRSRGKSSS